MRFRSQFIVQLLGGVLSTLAFLIFTPILIAQLGLDRYGVLLLVLGFLIYAGIAELGVGAATGREIAARDDDTRGRIFGNSILLSGSLAILGGTLFALLSLPRVAGIFVSDLEVVSELEQSGLLLFLLGAVAIIANVPKGVLYGCSSFVMLNLVNIFQTVASLLAPACYAIFYGNDLPGLLAAIVLGYVLTAVLAFAFCLMIRILPDLTFDWKIAQTLLTYGIWATASAILHRLTASLDRILISAFIGPPAVVVFAVPQGALERSQVLSGALLSVAFPRIARNPGDQGMIESCYRLLFLMAPVFVVGVVLLYPALEIWLGLEFANNAHSTAVLLAIAIWLDILSRVPYTILQARSALRQETQIAGSILVPNLLLLVFAVYAFGVVGAAAVAVLRSGAFLILRIRITNFPSHLRKPMLWNSFSVVLASLASHLYVADGQSVVAAGLWLCSAVVVSILNFRFALDLKRQLLPTKLEIRFRDK